MPFPDAERAVVTEEKVREYLLNPNHPVGGPKAAWFASIGYSIDNWQNLVDDLLMLAQSIEDFVAQPSPYGVKYQVTGRIGRPGHRPADVITVWIVEGNSSPSGLLQLKFRVDRLELDPSVVDLHLPVDAALA